MKTINWSNWNYWVVDWQQSFENKGNSVKKFITKQNQKIAQSLLNLSDRLINFTTNSEPKVWEQKDRQGNIYFRVYDPIRDRHIYFNSEAEVRYWLDKRYYL